MVFMRVVYAVVNEEGCGGPRVGSRKPFCCRENKFLFVKKISLQMKKICL